MTARRWLEAGAYVLGVAILACTWTRLVPGSLLADPWNPAHFSAAAAAVAFAGIVLFRLFLAGSLRLERLLLALILGFMPLVYVWAALLNGGARDVAIECAGLLVFGGIAMLGFLRSSLLLGLGIAAHGLCWDSWHHRQAAYIEGWYPLGCMGFDFAFGIHDRGLRVRRGSPG